MANTNETTTTVRMPAELAEMLKAHAEGEDRSVNWCIKDAVDEYLGNRRKLVLWPEETEFAGAGRATFQATLQWRMPNYCDLTDETIERMMVAICDTMRRYGVDDYIEVIGPIGVTPMALRNVLSYPPGVRSESVDSHQS